ncbi:hypothetical protein MRX96_049132 [Rhipicephalus microplus]
MCFGFTARLRALRCCRRLELRHSTHARCSPAKPRFPAAAHARRALGHGRTRTSGKACAAGLRQAAHFWRDSVLGSAAPGTAPRVPIDPGVEAKDAGRRMRIRSQLAGALGKEGGENRGTDGGGDREERKEAEEAIKDLGEHREYRH